MNGDRVSNVRPHYHIIGDVYVDLLCYVPSVSSNNVLPLNGTDTSIQQPITIMAGGSTINTATYLQCLHGYEQQHRNSNIIHTNNNSQSKVNGTVSSSLIISQHKKHPSIASSQNQQLINVHTMYNSNDYYGSILTQHCNKKEHFITLRNGYCNYVDSNKDNNIGNNDAASLLSTPHCIVMISKNDSTSTTERTFLTHRGCASNMTISHLFSKNRSSELVVESQQQQKLQQGANNQLQNGPSHGRHPIHVHIAGYYCTPGFWNDKHQPGASSLSLTEFVNNLFSPLSTSSNKYQYPTIVSLVTQYDSSLTWDIQNNLQHILPYVQICIMNELEAIQIFRKNYNANNDKNINLSEDDVLFDKGTSGNDVEETEKQTLIHRIVRFFTNYSSSTMYVVTQGRNGAIVFRNGKIIAQIQNTVDIESVLIQYHQQQSDVISASNNNIVLDPTGAGDAFCAGFFHSLWQSIRWNSNYDNDIDTEETTRRTLYRPSNYYWPDDEMSFGKNQTIQNALLWGCTMGTCCVSQRGGSTLPSNTIIQMVYDQYTKMNQ